MAKLNGVNVLDMVDGNVTKVAYDGAEYVKVDNVEAPIDGDIALNNEDSPSYTKGAFYALSGKERTGHFMTVSDDNDSKTNGKHPEYFTVFRKVSVTTPTIDERVDSLEKRVGALEEKPAQVSTFNEGDIIVITESNYDMGDKSNVGWAKSGQGLMKSGAIGEVISVNGNLATVKFDDNQPAKDTRSEYRQAFVLHVEEMRHATPAERQAYEDSLKPKPKFSIGDYVMPTEDEPDSADVKKGEKLQITNRYTKHDGTYTYNVNGGWAIKERYLTKYDGLKPRLNTGDFVKFSENYEGINSSKRYEVESDGKGGLYFVDDDGDKRWRPLANLGDFPYKIVAPPTAFERAGRKEGEFKKGDIARLTECSGAHEKGTLIEIANDGASLYFDLDGSRYGCHKTWVELIAPVESRVDRPCA